MPETVLVDNREGLNKLRNKWDALFELCPGAGIFQSWEWVASCAEFFSRDNSISLLCVQEEGRVIGIAPLEITRVPGLPVRRLQFIGTGVSDSLDFLVLPGFEEEFFGAVRTWLEENFRLWDVMDLQDLPPSSQTPRAFACRRWRSVCRDQNVNYYMELPATWDEFLQGLSKKRRHEIRRLERVMREDHDVLCTVLPREELTQGIDTLFSLHTGRWQQRGETGIFYGENRRKFYTQVAGLLWDKGWLRMQGIKLDGRLKAVGWCFACKGRAGYYITGWDTSLACLSIGSNLLSFSVRDSIEQGLAEYDFLRGNEDYKSHWTKNVRMTRRLVIHRGDLRSLLAACAAAAERRIGYRTRRLLQKCLHRTESPA